MREPLILRQVPPPGKQNHQMFYSEKKNGDKEQPAFHGHVNALIAMNRNFSALTAAWRATGNVAYFNAAVQQMDAWFLHPQTRMLPTLALAGVVPGIDDERNSGLADVAALAESARAAAFLCASPSLPPEKAAGMRAWFANLLQWLDESKKGSIARQTKAVEAVCWTMLAGEFSRFTRDDVQYRACAHKFRDNLLRQMNLDGNFTAALRDENPYATSMFTLECMSSACESLSTPFDSMWNAMLPDGRGMHAAVAWAMPFLRDRGKWPYVADREDFKQQPVRENALLFAGRAYDLPDYIDVWKTLPPDSPVAAIARAHPITQPSLWTTRPPA